MRSGDNEYLKQAEELISVYHNLQHEGLNDVRDTNASIRCALVTVNEIMKACSRYPYGIEYLSQIDFWEGVKNELNQMAGIGKPLPDCQDCKGSGGVQIGEFEYDTCPCVNTFK